MADDLDDGEFWLPSQFLSDDEILMEKKTITNNDGLRTDTEGVGLHGFSSDLSSPVESVVGSTTESDEEDYMAGLTLQMAHSMFQDDDKNPISSFGAENPKTRVLAGSPQSTLCEVGSWSGCSAESSYESPNGPSEVSTPMNDKEDDAWYLLYAAAGQVAWMKMNNELPRNHHGRGLLEHPLKPDTVFEPLKNPGAGVYPNQALTHHQQLQVNQFQQLKQQQLMKQQRLADWGRQVKVAGISQQHQTRALLQNRERTCGYASNRCGKPLTSSTSTWPTQQQGSSGMRAVFLGGSGSRKESCGTGVFLPRRIGNPSESRKKPACSTVLLPARVVEALNMKFDDSGPQPRFSGDFTLEQDAIMGRSNTGMLYQQKRNNRCPPAMNHGLRLPQEWTY
ncbi:hypothetical protein HHK36_018457 [Tetracentron sinense]|uniref:Uncharacterized protein n=1 Tax=Tetracentron sinense TaxID=13715 RepID=A0A834YVW2_TETSI|nr:hypothetical protein HHK36_018457 [Tetracentron sinense]